MNGEHGRAPDPQHQFDACRALREAGWSHFQISAALGITLSQVRVALDPKAQRAHERWASR